MRRGTDVPLIGGLTMRHPMKTAFLAALGAVVFATVAMPACSYAAAAAPLPKSATDSPVEQALDTKIDLDLEKTPLVQALLYIKQACPALGLTIDPEVTRVGAEFANCTVTMKVKQLPVRGALRVMLSRILVFKVTDGGVVVMTPAKMQKDVSTVSYPVKDILDRLSARNKALDDDGRAVAPPSSVDVDAVYCKPPKVLLNVVSGVVELTGGPEVLWRKNGAGGDDFTDDSLIILQTPRGHELVAQFLDLLRKGLAAPDGGAIAFPEPEGVAETRRRLGELVDLDFEKTSLDNVLKFISEVQRGLNIIIAPDLEADGFDLSTRVIDFKAKRVSVASVLDLVLGSDLAYRVEPGYVLITTRERYYSENLAVALYPATDILHAILKHRILTCASSDVGRELVAAYDELLGACPWVVSSSADPRIALWSDEGGPAMVDLLAGILIVRQTPEGQERTVAFLNLLRQAFALRDASLAKPPAPTQVLAAGDPVSPEEAEMLRRLGREIEISLSKTRLDKFLKFVGEAGSGLTIVIDPDVAWSGIDLSTREVTLAGRMAVESALLKALGDDLTYLAMPDYVFITKCENALRGLPFVLYPVADIIDAAMKKHAPAVFQKSLGQEGEELRAQVYEEATNQLIELLKDEVSTDPRAARWTSDGICDKITHLAGVLVVAQTRRGHEKVAEFLTQLRRELQAPQK